jgi:ribosome-associated translation inhibitor RaiA
MAEQPLLTITLSKNGNTFRADLHAPSGMKGVADLRLEGISENAVQAIETCLTELESRAADGDQTALRFSSD